MVETTQGVLYPYAICVFSVCLPHFLHTLFDFIYLQYKLFGIVFISKHFTLLGPMGLSGLK